MAKRRKVTSQKETEREIEETLEFLEEELKRAAVEMEETIKAGRDPNSVY